MQSRPTEASKQSSPQQAPVTPVPTTQDGLSSQHLRPHDSLLDQDGSAAPGHLPPEPDPLEHAQQSKTLQATESPALRLKGSESPVQESNSLSVVEERSLQVKPNSHEGLELRLSAVLAPRTSTTRHLLDLPNEVLVDVLTHLPPEALSTITLVSRRFHDLVTTPHAWRAAFCRHFLGAQALPSRRTKEHQDVDIISKREFSRLTTFATWRSEYILRPKLLDALERGRPSQVLVPSSNSRNSRINSLQNGAQLAYPSHLIAPIDSLHCNFQAESNRRSLRIVHGTSYGGKASVSDPLNGKVEAWGSGDPMIFNHFEDTHPNEVPYGLGPGSVVGSPNSMDVSQLYGMVIGEGCPGGGVYYRSISEQQGRRLFTTHGERVLQEGIPKLVPSSESICCVWIAKTSNIPSMSNNLVGLLSGSSSGIVSAYSVGQGSGSRSRGFPRGEITAKWVLSPGVPIISIVVDDNYNTTRSSRNRVWAAALNALGEVFYITAMPQTLDEPCKANVGPSELYQKAWKTGRTVFWSFVECSRRSPRSDLAACENTNAAYSPRSSWDGMTLSKEQIAAETAEIETYIKKTPKQIQQLCLGWDMRRRFEVDFAGDDKHDAGEVLVVFECGLGEDELTSVKRFIRLQVQNASPSPTSSANTSPPQSPTVSAAPISGAGQAVLSLNSAWSFTGSISEQHGSSPESPQTPRAEVIEVWRESKLSLGGLKYPKITCTALDNSTYAQLAAFEDPLLSSTASNTSSPFATPPRNTPQHAKAADIVGQRARLVAAGTFLGSILVWNMRASPYSNKSIRPIRIISARDVREISCIALTALCLVHGDVAGVVQAWDPLASITPPIRTLHSRFSSRQRRQLLEASNLPHGTGINIFRAGAIALDPDPTIIRGVVALGNSLHYWSYSSSDAAKYKPGKRRLRRSPRGSNQTPDRISRLGRDAIKDYISKEQAELQHDEKARRKEQKRLAGRFGTDILGPSATDEELIAYATMLSQEAALSDRVRALSESASSDTATEPFSSPPSTASGIAIPDDDPDLAKAVLLSLQEAGAPDLDSTERAAQTSDIPVLHAKKSGNKSPSGSPPATAAGSSAQPEMYDLEFALQLSRAEAQSMTEWQKDFPILERRSSDETEGKGKGKASRIH